jgi:phytoene desaturase (3,4-didehydrolycopene-forming)
VDEVIVSPDHKVTGVKLSTGEVIAADLVVINADLVYSYRHLLPRSPPTLMTQIILSIPVLARLASPTPASLAARKPSCSSISFYWSMDRVIPQLGAHNVFLAGDYQVSFDEIFKLHQMPAQPSFYVNVPSRVDGSAAPEGKDSIVVLVPIGCLSGDRDPAADVQNVDEQVACARRVVLRTLEAWLGVTGIQEWIVHEMINTPITCGLFRSSCFARLLDEC